jgi:putative NADH-flavin reductase
MRVLVIGATGATGQEMVKQAEERGHAVTALVHDAAILTNGPAKGQAEVRALTELSGTYAGKISRADVAGFCLSELADNRYLAQAPVITY